MTNTAQSPARSTAASIHEALRSMISRYAQMKGISEDSYSDVPQWHAMAEALYLETILIMHSSGLLTKSHAVDQVKASVQRLKAGAIQRHEGVFSQWGLGFPYKAIPPTEPFLVTTALATRALASATKLLPCSGALAREGFAGLSRFLLIRIRCSDREIMLPAYAPSLNEVVDNAVALWAQVVLGNSSTTLFQLGADTVERAKLAMAWVNSRFVTGLGWAYSEKNQVFDLLHQTYILESLLGFFSTAGLEQKAFETLSRFRAGSGYIDTITLTERSKAIETVTRSGAHYLFFDSDFTFVVKAEAARLWSLGGLLGCLGLLSEDGKHKAYWLSQIRRFSMHMLPERFGADFRQEMHLARGAALALKALRGQARELDNK